MTKDEALRLALEALEKLFGTPPTQWGGDVAVWRLGGSYRTQQAIHAIKEALAQPEQEPNHGDELTIAYMSGLHKGKELAPQRTWVGLTYEDMIEVWNKLYKERTDVMPLPTTFAKAIEAKLKQKNGYAEEKNT